MRRLKVKIACNYYQETEELLDEKKIDIDYFKYPALGFQMKIMERFDAFEDFCNRVTRKRPILLHGLNCGDTYQRMDCGVR